ncbi:MAG: hypothetical protein ACHP8A_02585 [Terriglobales bacterium]|jgi:hypothetical protein|nr:hypothetical protein [Terriglobales bacterium]
MLAFRQLAKPTTVAVTVLFIFVLKAKAGPPFQTDDPEPVDFLHYELYAFGNASGTGVEMDTAGPAIEFNWGVLPNTQFHIVVPAVSVMPSNTPNYLPAGAGPSAFGVGDIEIGVKYKFIAETKHRPMFGIFPMIEAPNGNSNTGLGVGKTWAKLPVWVQKSFGPWTTYGGLGEEIVPQTGYRNFAYGGWLVQRNLGKKWTLGTEVFSHGAEGLATPQIRGATLLDIGGYYYIRNPGFQILFCYGHSVAGLAETYAYSGLYWTWGNPKRDAKPDNSLRGKMHFPETSALR